MKKSCLVVIGHVDHGKTSLVRALTGTDTDRLPEEKKRGLSITTGFAHRAYTSGTVDFIDAPGHSDFIQAMVAGASGADAALIVVSATQGVQAQTSEHLRIAELLGIRRAVVAVTMCDLGQPDLSELKQTLEPTAFSAAPVIVCSSTTGEGLANLNQAIETLLGAPAGSEGPGNSFLPIDRIFSISGHGTVVTGTLLGADLAAQDAISIYPQNKPLLIRGLQNRGADCEVASSGTRVAVNLRGVSANEIKRGQVIAATGSLTSGRFMDVRLDMTPAKLARLRSHQDVRVHIGTLSTIARLQRLGRDFEESLHFAQLRFVEEVPAFQGQRAIIRGLSPPRTLGGIIILDPSARPTRQNDQLRIRVLEACVTKDADQIAHALTSECKSASVAKLATLLGRNADEVAQLLSDDFMMVGEGLFARQHDLDSVRLGVLEVLRGYHEAHPIEVGVPAKLVFGKRMDPYIKAHVEDTLLSDGLVRRTKFGPALTGHAPRSALNCVQERQLAAIEDTFRQAGLDPVDPRATLVGSLDQTLFDILQDSQAVIALPNIALRQQLYFHADVLDECADTLRRSFPVTTVFTTSEARVALKTSRRVIVPLLEYFDRMGITARTGNTRQILE